MEKLTGITLNGKTVECPRPDSSRAVVLTPKVLTHWQDWNDCKRCPLGKSAFRHVLFEVVGDTATRLPVAFMGEAPGESEDTTGRPFIGASGKLLRGCIDEVHGGRAYAIFNTLACRPVLNGHDRPPTEKEKKVCRPRVVELIRMLKPVVIVSLGRHAEASINLVVGTEDLGYKPHVMNCWHPSYILRHGGKVSDKYQVMKNVVEAAFVCGERWGKDQEL